MPKQCTYFQDKPLADAFDQQLAQNWLPLEITQLSAGSYQGLLREIQHDDVSIIFEYQNCMVHKRGIMQEPFCTVSFARSIDANVRLSEHYCEDDSLFFIPSGKELDIQVGGNVETVYFRFDQAQFLKRARVITPQYWQTDPDDIVIFNSGLRKELEAFCCYLYSLPFFQPAAAVSVYNQILGSSIMDRLLLAIDASSIDNERCQSLIICRRAKERVSQALEFIDATLSNGTCPSIVDICIQINTSQRNLQYSFKKVLGFTPNAYLYYLRLNRARQQLSKPDSTHVTVTLVATYWQFWHLGRFANDYLQLFGELPSATLFRALN